MRLPLFFAWLLSFSALADPPTVEHLFPAGFAHGTTNTVTVAGKLEPWPPGVWVDCAGVEFHAETNKGTFRVEVAAGTPLGAHLARFYNIEGTSAPRLFIITDGRELREAEPNDHFTNAQPSGVLPVVFNGQLNKAGDVDSFAVRLDAGQWLDASVEAYTLASKMDALLRVVTTNGMPLAWNHDFVTLDPRLIWPAPSNGTYIVQLMGFKYPADAEVRFTGGEGCVYRLHLDATSSGPHARPEGAQEIEPNDTFEQAALVTLPATIVGDIEAAGAEDCFRFKAKSGEFIEARVEAASLGSALDGWLKITDAQGKELARNDDSDGSRDPRLEWKAPTNGTYAVVVGSLLQQDGEAHWYRLALRSAPPDYLATLASMALRVSPGETNDLKLTVKRLRGFDHPLEASLTGLPDGVTAAAVEIGKKAGDAVFKLVAQPHSPPWNGPIQVEITDSATEETRLATVSLTASTEDNGVPGGYTRLAIDTIENLWLTVRAKPPEKAK